jgi:hypothetical protein
VEESAATALSGTAAPAVPVFATAVAALAVPLSAAAVATAAAAQLAPPTGTVALSSQPPVDFPLGSVKITSPTLHPLELKVQVTKPDPTRLFSVAKLQQFGLQVSSRSSTLHEKLKAGSYITVQERLQDIGQFIQKELAAGHLDSSESGLVALTRHGRKGLLLDEEQATALILIFQSSEQRNETCNRMAESDLNPSIPVPMSA